MLNVYTDGSCRPTNPGKGGWAYVTEDGRKGSDGALDTTNNRAELMAAILALEQLSDSPLKIFSDSQYLIFTMTRGWKRKKNIDLWERLDKAVESREVHWEWVKGHNGHPMNELADTLATQAALS